MRARVALAWAIALSMAAVSPHISQYGSVQASALSPGLVADAPAPPELSAWQQQWQRLLRREDQLRRDERQVQEIAPRLPPQLVDRLQQGLELTRQRLAQERQQLLQQQPEAIPAIEITAEPASGSPLPGVSTLSAWPRG
jgi:hypothetical protein